MNEYKPSRFLLPTSHYDREKADRAVMFIESLRHTKGSYYNKPFKLLNWQETIIRDLFGVVKEDGNRQFKQCITFCAKKNGKTELAVAIALYLLCADHEQRAEIYGAAADRQMAGLVYSVAADMIRLSPAFAKTVQNPRQPQAHHLYAYEFFLPGSLVRCGPSPRCVCPWRDRG